MSTSVITQLFTEKFRPQDLSTLIAVPRIKNELSKGLIQNILLYGGAGCGKTSTLYILSKPYTTLYINASSERGIDIVRDKIANFCSTISLENGREKLKCVLLDEFDGATPEFFNAYRSNSERFSNVARFIASCNYIEKIPEPIKSRFNCISFDPIDAEEETYLIEEYKKRISYIMNAAKINHTPEILDKFVNNKFPDMRALMNSVQSLYLRGIKELNDKNFNVNFDFKDLFDLCLNKPDKPYENYKLIANEYSNKIDEAIVSLGNDFVDYIKQNAPQKIDKIPLVIIAVAEHQYQLQFVIDKLVTLLSCIYKLQIILNS